MKNITPALITRLQTLRREQKLTDDAYRAMIAGVSDGRTTSTKELTQVEAFSAINSLVGIQHTQRIHEGDKELTEVDKMRRKILSRFHRMKWYLPGVAPIASTATGGLVVGQLDYKRINQWMVDYSYLHKPLNKYSESELPDLVSQVDKVYKSILKNK